MARTTLAALLFLWLLDGTLSQLAGKNKPEGHPRIMLSTCSKSKGCMAEQTHLTMDSQWRWLHDPTFKNCLKEHDKKWVVKPETCSTTCALEGISHEDYKKTYGVTEVPGGVSLQYVNGPSIGSRLYMLDSNKETYRMFKLLNREFSFEVDVASLDCGVNGALYFVEMQADGGLGLGKNKAGARYGTGYCDAQCPHDLKFIAGECNIKDWHMTPTGPVGHYGSCCSEMDIWESNAKATALTAHPCDTLGPLRCDGNSTGEGKGTQNVCGDTPEDCHCCHDLDNCPCCGRFEGVCDKDGCDWNPFRLGNTSFFGEGPDFAVDSGKPVTVVTQFITSDGTDAGELSEIRRLYIQDGKVIKNSIAKNAGSDEADSLTDDFCDQQKIAFDNPNDFKKKGGMRVMGQALRRGMVLVLSIWDDTLTEMNWLDSLTPEHASATQPGVKRGPCDVSAGKPSTLRKKNKDATVTYRDIKIGEIGSTYKVRELPEESSQVATLSDVDIAGPVCCTSGKGPDHCSGCVEVKREGFCANEGACGNCGGKWCPHGVTTVEEFELGSALPHSLGHSSPGVPAVLALAAASAVVLGAAGALRFKWTSDRHFSSMGSGQANYMEVACDNPAA